MARRFSYSPTEAKLCPTPLGARNYPRLPIFEQFRSILFTAPSRQSCTRYRASISAVESRSWVMAHWNRPEGFCARIAIRLGSMNFALSLPHAANARLGLYLANVGDRGFYAEGILDRSP